jgi:deazaflavin-dependent oxidoreductase (nitroreductase family)
MSGQGDSQFLYLTTVGWKTGNFHEIEIWFVEYGGRYYLVSEKREQAHWVVNIQHNPHVAFWIGDEGWDGEARLVDPDAEPELAVEVSARMDAKYGWSDGLIVELRPVAPAS